MWLKKQRNVKITGSRLDLRLLSFPLRNSERPALDAPYKKKVNKKTKGMKIR